MQTQSSQSTQSQEDPTSIIHAGEHYVTRLAVDAEDREAVFELRHRVYVQEMRLLKLFGDCKGKIEDHWDQNADLIATFTESGEAVGTCRLNYGQSESELPYAPMMKYGQYPLQKGEVYCYASRTMVDAAHRKGGMALHSMMKEFCAVLTNRNVRYAFLYCQPHLIPTFSAMGFRVYSEPVSHEEIGNVVPMVFDVKDLSYLREIRAVTYRYLRRTVH